MLQLQLELKQYLTKLECKALVQALKAFQTYLYSYYFIIKTNIKVLIIQLNQLLLDLLGLVINQQLVIILQQNFNIIYILGKKNIISNALLRYLQLKSQRPLEQNKNNLELFINQILDKYNKSSLVLNIKGSTLRILVEKYSNNSKEIIEYLLSL